MNEDNTVKFSANYYLYVALKERTSAEMWMPDLAEWDVVAANARLSVDEAYDTLLVKGLEVCVTVGLGRELIALDNARGDPVHIVYNTAPVTCEVRCASCRRLFALTALFGIRC